MDSLLKDSDTRNKWYQMPIELQISNIGSEVLRADRWKQKKNPKRMRAFYKAAIEFLILSIQDPKNRCRVNELNLLIDELADYFIGDNRWGTTSAALEKYYNQFL